jgi:hypothetical protein
LVTVVVESVEVVSLELEEDVSIVELTFEELVALSGGVVCPELVEREDAGSSAAKARDIQLKILAEAEGAEVSVAGGAGGGASLLGGVVLAGGAVGASGSVVVTVPSGLMVWIREEVACPRLACSELVERVESVEVACPELVEVARSSAVAGSSFIAQENLRVMLLGTVFSGTSPVKPPQNI